MSDVWLKMAQFLGSLNGEDINRESYVRTPEYEKALEAWKETFIYFIFRRETVYENLLEWYFQKHHRPEGKAAPHSTGAFPGCPCRQAPAPGHGVEAFKG